MGFDVGAKKGSVRPSMNVTPLVDVVLVLLIIFMVITPMMTKQFLVNVPEKENPDEPLPPPSPDAPPPVVLKLRADGALTLNQDVIARSDLRDRLRRVFAARRDDILFFDSEDGVPYGDAMDVLDLARGGGARTIVVLADGD